ncbi:MAG TPA: phytase [Candidatus Sulfomarinibacteraceae bacterium]|nr:phytase [Candidatus Sulfomarinibacteraceae bacterium]
MKTTLATPTGNPSHSTTAVLLVALVAVITVACAPTAPPGPETAPTPEAPAALTPVVITEQTPVDSDDPAIWIHPDDPSKSLVLGTDKGGAVVAFDLDGAIIPDKTVTGLQRMNNIDVEYGLPLGDETIDIAVATERPASAVRVFRLPEMVAIDNGGIPVFEGESGDAALPMGIALYKRPSDGAVFAVVSRKTGPSGSYLWQYRLADDGNGAVVATKVREFGAFSDATSLDESGVPELGEIESIAVDDVLGYVYYSDELTGVRKYHADPDAPDADAELALFATDGFADQREGISIYTVDDGTGYILVSDQQGNAFRIYTREGSPGNPHDHRFVKSVAVSTNESDGSDVTNVPLGDRFPSGLFVAMSDNRTFHYYSWADIAGDDLVEAPNGTPSSE